MESSRVWKNLLSGKQAVPTVACPSCGAQVPEFRIHSHLDTCLTTLPSAVTEEEAVVVAGEVVHELSDGEQNRHRRGQAGGARGQGRGRGRGKKRREVAERKGRDGDTGRRKRARNDTGGGDNVEDEKADGAPACSDEDDDDGNFYQYWEYSVSGMDELAKSRKESPLTDLQKQELSASGVLTIERREVSAMVFQLDRLLANFQAPEGAADGSSMSFGRMPRVRNGNGFQIPAVNQVGVPEQFSRTSARMNTADAEGGQQSRGQRAINLNDYKLHNGSQSKERKALEAWWEQWITVEWPEGPMPSGFHAGLPQRLGSQWQDDHTDMEKMGMGRSAAQETSLMKAHYGEQRSPRELSSHSKPNVEHSAVAESSIRNAGPPPPTTAPANNPADINGASPGLQACPICNFSFAPNSSNGDINKHIDECLNAMACLLD